jgi:hypothetical protein
MFNKQIKWSQEKRHKMYREIVREIGLIDIGTKKSRPWQNANRTTTYWKDLRESLAGSRSHSKPRLSGLQHLKCRLWVDRTSAISS